MSDKYKKIILLFGDVAILYFSLYLTLLLRYFEQPSALMWGAHLLPFTTVFFFWILIFYISDLYNFNSAINNSKFYQNTIRAVTIAGLLSAVYFYTNSSIRIAPKTNLVIYLAVFSVFFIVWRHVFNRILYSFFPRDNIVIIGYDGQVAKILKALEGKPQLGYKIALIVSNETIENIETTNDISKLNEIIKEKKVSTIVLARDPRERSELRSYLFSCLPLKINFMSLPRFYEQVTGRVPIEAINEMWFLENLNEGSKKIFDFLKRAYDIVFSLFIITITAIFWPIIGAIIKLESKGPVFFIQIRAGKNNRPFKLIKFRTMREENNTRTPTAKSDGRITKFGKIMRKTRIDEIPQTLNIFFGNMSFIGPRPERPELIAELEKQIPFYRERMLVKPGLSGWDQVSGEYHSPSREDTLKKLQYDLFYIKNRSLFLDATIILKTIATVVSREGV
ncbi:MAG: exopolysaccharide biosynthesis polyprenyl glycosylphosphotransferase [bacterium]